MGQLARRHSSIQFCANHSKIPFRLRDTNDHVSLIGTHDGVVICRISIP